MQFLIFGILLRILSNSYLNVFQKTLTNSGEKPSVINFYTYLGLGIISVIICPHLTFNPEILINLLTMGFLGAIGNYFIIKALSCGELSSLAPINSYKPVFALIFGVFLLGEIPNPKALLGIGLIIAGTVFMHSEKLFFTKASLYRFFALILSAGEAIFIKRIILLTSPAQAFTYWAFAGLIFSTVFVIASRHKIKISPKDIKFQIALILSAGIMQYSTNYVFSKINVAYALALFQLSTILSVFLGVNIFKESKFIRKILASLVMVCGAVIILLSNT